MRATIDALTYDTETAEEIASDSGGGHCNDFHRWEETLYCTKKGNYFLHGTGGPLSHYSEGGADGNSRSGGSKIRPLTKEEALTWCEEHACQAAIDEHFTDLVEEA